MNFLSKLVKGFRLTRAIRRPKPIDPDHISPIEFTVAADKAEKRDLIGHLYYKIDDDKGEAIALQDHREFLCLLLIHEKSIGALDEDQGEDAVD